MIMDHSYGASYQNVRLRPLEKRDIEQLRIWRNDPSQTRFLRPLGFITPEMQEKWFANYRENEDEITFAVEETELLHKMVGSVALYNFRGDTAEIGKIQIGEEKAHGLGIGKRTLEMACWIGFRTLGLKKIVSSVHRENLAAYRNNQKVGFVVAGNHPACVGGVEDEIEITGKRLTEVCPHVREIILMS